MFDRTAGVRIGQSGRTFASTLAIEDAGADTAPVPAVVSGGGGCGGGAGASGAETGAAGASGLGAAFANDKLPVVDRGCKLLNAFSVANETSHECKNATPPGALVAGADKPKVEVECVAGCGCESLLVAVVFANEMLDGFGCIVRSWC